MKLKKSVVTSLLFSLLSTQSYAFRVDKMVLVSDQKGNGVITLTNDEEDPLFILSEIEELKVDGNDIVKKKYDRNNLDEWKISLTNQKLILAPGEEKDIGIRSLCHNTTCDDSRDLMFMLPFSPSKYRTEEQETSGVEINYGFAPIYIIPTSKPVYSYEILNKGATMIVNNKSNTLLNLYLDSCDSKNSIQCKQKFTVVAGRNKTFPLTEAMQSDELNITVNSHDRSYSKSISVLKGR
ncbi:hypothetical protein [Vibrio apostichopi]|uniref:hypothetical protein n=1 Tax=Vibrio apostichopi TaxID=3035453 RepID=UPI002572ED46|nr:hypothetical protein [Vibrio sp. FE10]